MIKYTFSLAVAAFLLVMGCNKAQPKPFQPDLHVVNTGVRITEFLPFTRQFNIAELELVSKTDRRVKYKVKSLGDPGARVTDEGVEFTYEQLGPNTMELGLIQPHETITLDFDNISKSVILKEKGINLIGDGMQQLTLAQQTIVGLMLALQMELTGEGPRGPVDFDPSMKFCKYTATVLETSRSEALGHLTKYVDDYLNKHPQCQKHYGQDSGCLWGDYGCVATQQIKCTCR